MTEKVSVKSEKSVERLGGKRTYVPIYSSSY